MNNNKKSKVLCIVSHPDDEVLGLRGTIIKHTEQNDKVYIIIMSEGEVAKKAIKEKNKFRLKNASEWAKFSGCNLYKVFNYPDQRLDTIPQLEIVIELEKIINLINPNLVYTHFPFDLNKDHQVTANASLVALRPINTIAEIRSFETPSSTEQLPQINNYVFKPNLYVDISKQWKKKSQGLKIYSKEIKKFPHPRSMKSIKSLALKRGSEAGLEMAEAFIVLRKVII